MAKGVKKVKEAIIEEPEVVTEEVDDDVEEIVEEPVKVIVKPKRKLTEAQLENLRKGRELGKLKLKEHAQKKHTDYVEKVKIEKAVKTAKEETKTRSIEDLKKVADTYELRKKIDTIDEKLSHYLDEKKERRKMKDGGEIQKTVKQQLPNLVNNALMKDKMNGEYNMYLGRI